VVQMVHQERVGQLVRQDLELSIIM
jgi:hypothetical protein